MKKIVFVLLSAFVSLAWDWPHLSLTEKKKETIKVQKIWAVDTVKNQSLRVQLVNNSPPLITKNLVIQGNAINGVKAYEKTKGEKLWEFEVPAGVSSPLGEYQGNIYFGGADGFFYSLQKDKGRLNWKFWTGSENLGPPLIHEGKIYWVANNQKLYALNLKGELLWMYAGPSFSKKGFAIRGQTRPVIYRNWVYVGFNEGTVLALNKNTGRLKWKKNLSSLKPITENLGLSRNCLFVPVLDFYLFCLQALTGHVRWKTEGGSASVLEGKKVIYQFYKGELLALQKANGKVIWKKKIDFDYIFPPLSFKKFLVYGSPNEGKIIFTDKQNGNTLKEMFFGRGLASPVRADQQTGDLYFSSIDGWLYKLSVL